MPGPILRRSATSLSTFRLEGQEARPILGQPSRRTPTTPRAPAGLGLTLSRHLTRSIKRRISRVYKGLGAASRPSATDRTSVTPAGLAGPSVTRPTPRMPSKTTFVGLTNAL